jgi:hypothetical protein
VAETRAWVERAVIGLGLCPFARGAQARGRVRYACSPACEPEALLEDFCAEVRHLLATPAAEVETTLLVHPWVLGRFAAYNDFLDVADAALEALGAEGILQVASFHPRYRFVGLPADDVTHATNRSPHPVLQLLREASVASAVESWRDTGAIVEANLATARRLGPAGWSALRAACRADTRRARAVSGAPEVLPAPRVPASGRRSARPVSSLPRRRTAPR